MACRNKFVPAATWRPKPSPAHPDKQFGVLAFVYGTVVTSAIAMLLAVPLTVMLKIVCEHLDATRPLARLVSDE